MAVDLHKIEFIKAYLRLEFQDPYVLTVETLLRLRRNLRQAAKQVELLPAGLNGLAFDALFDPPVSPDPFARRRYQLPGPPFVIHPPLNLPLPAVIEGALQLPVVLFGQGTHLLRELCLAFQALGVRGFHRGEGFFELSAVDAEDLSGNRTCIWRQGGRTPLSVPLLNAGWWLDSFSAAPQICLQLHTPARLLSDGRPLFRPGFSALFPFIMRRVTAMVHAHCGQELVDDPGFYILACQQVRELENSLGWRDWRSLEGDGRRQDVGGVVGALTLSGGALQDVLWLLRLASLLNLGKGAAFGAGHLTISDKL
ncbi:CRISPR system precrRNA processing endoribonuclease RAMP protein Cas6 [Trichloromonas sp.]|uniref:CRISPR system precrRNA processing endoribonuclease RAMP protein Cas6 n=1 Tax=Trichloromonas sp. TaxID=3069249 RepID=UPI003D819922